LGKPGRIGDLQQEIGGVAIGIAGNFKVGKTDLNYVELKEGLNKNDIVYVLPSEGLIKSQQRFSERLRNRFS